MKSLAINKLSHYPDLLLTLTRIERSIQAYPSKVLYLSTYLKLESLSNPSNTLELPIFKLTLSFISYVSLEKILESLTTFETRKLWDLNLVSLTEKEGLVHSTFQYSIYQAEFFEDLSLFTHEEKAGILLKSSSEGFGGDEKFVRPKTLFSLYSVKENDGNSIIEIFFKIDPKTFLASVVVDVVQDKILIWAESFFKHLNS